MFIKPLLLLTSFARSSHFLEGGVPVFLLKILQCDVRIALVDPFLVFPVKIESHGEEVNELGTAEKTKAQAEANNSPKIGNINNKIVNSTG